MRRAPPWIVPVLALLAACSSLPDDEPLPGYQRDGSYILSGRERSQSCERLEADRRRHEQLAATARAQVEAQRKQPPSTMLGVVERMTGSHLADSKAELDVKVNLAARDAFAAEIAARPCPPPEG